MSLYIFEPRPKRKLFWGGHICLCTRKRWGGVATWRIGRGLIGIYYWNRFVYPGGETSAQDKFLLFHVREVRRNAYFYSRINHRGRSQIGRVKTFWGSGPGGTYSEALHGWIFKSGEDGKRIYTSVETFLNWLANKSPSLETYFAFMSGRLIALDKHPGVCLVGVGETWRWFFAKIFYQGHRTWIRHFVSGWPALCRT